ncbi:MAG: hypothetical protein JXB30_10870 [Anaerolineae bacterium]|nr:hypothetical protein [Anaerolineae bacterium]
MHSRKRREGRVSSKRRRSPQRIDARICRKPPIYSGRLPRHAAVEIAQSILKRPRTAFVSGARA